MMAAMALLFDTIFRLFRSRQSLPLENLAIRQQLAVFKRRHPRPQLVAFDKLFWVLARRFWSGWKQALIIASPETVVRWHKSGFALYWRLISRARRVRGRKRISKQVRDLICRMVIENPTWGAPRIHGELRMLGFDVSERTVSRWMRRAPTDPEPAKRWLAFLRNHREAIAAMDFFTGSTISRRDLLDHVIALNEFHLKRLLSDYVRYYHDDRTHLGLGKETPGGRLRSVSNGHVIGRARLGGLHHRYDRAA